MTNNAEDVGGGMEEVMAKRKTKLVRTWIERTCDEANKLETLNTLADEGYLPYKITPIEVRSGVAAETSTTRLIILAYHKQVVVLRDGDR